MVDQWHTKTNNHSFIVPETISEKEIELAFNEVAKKMPAAREYLNHHWPYYQKLVHASGHLNSEFYKFKTQKTGW